MLTAPYSIYVNRRPLRAAFLIADKPESMKTIDAIFRHNRDRWGGRYNPIVITDGQKLTDAWWSLFEAVDPDVVKSFVELSDELVAGIERRVSPYLVLPPDRREQDDNRRRIHLPEDGLSILPTPLNIRAAKLTIDETCLVLFETDWKRTDPLIRHFVEWNFGVYSPPVLAVRRALEGVRTQRYSVTDAASLMTPLGELSAFKSFTYPIQLCSIPNDALPPVDYDRYAESFHVVIGDTPADVAYFWNRPASTPQWSRTYLNQVWLPIDIATNAQLATALSAWLQRLADPGGSHQSSIRFVSLSLLQEQLEEVAKPLMCQLRVSPRYVHALHEVQPPKIRARAPGPPNQDNMDLYRTTSSTERLTLKEPDLLQGPILGGHWMADLYIEFRPERYPHIIGRPLWWQLPRINRLSWQIFGRPSRILQTRYPSVLMKQGEPRLEIALPDDISVFTALATLQNQVHYLADPRHGKNNLTRAPYRMARSSEKGRYLSGLLDLFGGLLPATDTLEKRYWRRMFDLLSGHTAHKDAELLERVGNRLRKRFRANGVQFIEDDKAMTWLSNYVLKVARSLPASSRDLEFRVFEEEAKQEMQEFNSRLARKEPLDYSQAHLIRAVAELVERGVLLMGVQAKCPSCGYRAWHHIDNAKQTLNCGGCGASFTMRPEAHWCYRLNSLTRAAHAEHGLVPVVLVLGQLLIVEARSAFLFAPCLDLFDEVDNCHVGDLDIAVILDGRFLIGEVKQSRDLFDKATFVTMEGIARRLLPDTLLFASMDREPTALITKEITRLSEVLRPLGIDVQWYRLPESHFNAWPVR
jgi:hypothetical protein